MKKRGWQPAGLLVLSLFCVSVSWAAENSRQLIEALLTDQKITLDAGGKNLELHTSRPERGDHIVGGLDRETSALINPNSPKEVLHLHYPQWANRSDLTVWTGLRPSLRPKEFFEFKTTGRWLGSWLCSQLGYQHAVSVGSGPTRPNETKHNLGLEPTVAGNVLRDAGDTDAISDIYCSNDRLSISQITAKLNHIRDRVEYYRERGE